MVHLSYWFRRSLLKLVLGLFFVLLMHDLGDHHSAYAYQGKGMKEAYGVGESTVLDPKEPIEDTGKIWQGGRKMMIDGGKIKKEEGSSRISEKGFDAVPKRTPEKAQNQLNHQEHEKATLSSVQKVYKMKNIANEEESEDDEERRELMNEVANLMHKDYSRFGRRRPPINNHEPRH